MTGNEKCPWKNTGRSGTTEPGKATKKANLAETTKMVTDD